MTGAAWLDGVIYVGAVAVAVAAIGGALRWLYVKVWSRVHDFLEDWNGTEDRDGVPGRPGVMSQLRCLDERVSVIESEFAPNHGSSMKDQMDRIEQKLDSR